MNLYLTSSPTGSYRDGKEPEYQGLNPKNRFVENLKKDWKDNAKCLIISADPDAFMSNDEMRFFFEKKVRESGLSVREFHLCDRRNADEIMDKLLSYDMIILGGGHVPTQNDFFHQIGLIQKIKEFDGIVMGISAGSMNCAREVYAQPEIPGESISNTYQRFIEGLGLTECKILPHYHAVKNDILDGKRLMEDITYPDSVGRKFYVIPDGSYILQRNGIPQIYGEAFLIAEGELEKICDSGEEIYL